MSGTDILAQIVTRTRLKVAERRMRIPLEQLTGRAQTRAPRRSFADALARPGAVNVIAEYKRRSPSRGLIREDLDVVHVAHAYQQGGAVALSVLTESEWFGGSLEDLRQARQSTRLPVLRKDFIVDVYQVWETWHAEADALLLIVAALSDRQLAALLKEAREARLDALVEVHDEEELERAVAAGAEIVGVNNRNLKTLEVSLDTAVRLATRIPENVTAVAESGLHTREDVHRLRNEGYAAFLIGEHLMSAPDPGQALRAIVE